MSRILLIDDDAAIRSSTRRMLEREGYEVIEAAEGEAGIRQMRTQPVDLVLTDIYMPGEDGIATIRRLRREWPGVEIITMSGGSRAGPADLNAVAAAMGAGGTLSKPFSRLELLDAVRRAFASSLSAGWALKDCAATPGSQYEGVPMIAVTIALAEDHRVGGDGVRRLLEVEPDYVVVGEVSDGREVLPLVQRLEPQVLILDLLLPGLGGLEVTDQVTAKFPGTRVVILSQSHEDVFVLEALRNGAAAFVSQDGSDADLVRAVREVVAGRHFLSAPLSEIVIQAYLGGRTSARDVYGALTRREREVLHLVAQGFSSRGIAQRLGMSPRTAETHRAHVMHKLGVHSRAELIRFAARRGIVTPVPGQQSA